MEYRAYSFPEFPFDMLIIYHKDITRQDPSDLSPEAITRLQEIRHRIWESRNVIKWVSLYDLYSSQEEKEMSYAYVGCRTTKERNARGKGLKVFEINDKTGDWNLIQCLKTEEENPSYQTLDNEGNFSIPYTETRQKSPAIKFLKTELYLR